MDESSITTLPDDPNTLKALLEQREHRIAQLEKDRAERDERIASLKKECDQKIAELKEQRDQKIAELELARLRLAHQLELLKKRYYGPRADRVNINQLLLDFARELEQRPVNQQDLPPQADESTEDKKTIRRVRRGRRSLAESTHLPVVQVVHDLKEDERSCELGHTRKLIGQTVTWQLEFFPGFFYRVEHVQKKYACAVCDQEAFNPQIVLAPKPHQPIDKGLPGPGLLAFITTSKFADYMPLYRLQNHFSRNGFEIDRSTMCVWMGDVADLITPVYDLMVKRVLESHVIATDDTVMPMWAPGKTRPARMWIYRGDDEHPYNIFDFTISRSRDGPASFLKQFHGTLLADAYGGYDGICIEKYIVQAGCWAHARRKFIDSQSLCPQVADAVLARISALFGIEKSIKGHTAAERLAARQARSLPLLSDLYNLLLTHKDQLLPKHPVAQAIGYALNQWKPLNVFAGDGAVDIDNNLAEQEMKRQALNRKNSLFVGNERGGRTAAILSSITSTCRRHAIDPQLYLTQLLTNLPGTPMSQVDQWLPDVWKLRQTEPVPPVEALRPLFFPEK